MSKISFYKRIITEHRNMESKVQQFFYSFLQIVFRIFDKFYFDNCVIRASGLAFNSLLALVPLSAVIFAFGGMKNVSTSLQDFLVDVLLPSSLNQIIDALDLFTENSTRLGTYGIVFFLITILLLMNNIENNLNYIWHCKRKRNFFQQFTIYTTVIVFGSLLIGGNFSISGNILAIIPDYAAALREPFLIKLGYRLSSITFITLTFLLIILLIPSVKAAFKSALAGALTGALLWELAKWGFKAWANYSVRNSVIYGSLFLIPLLLVWLYVVWLIIMIAMETAYIHDHRKEPHIRYNEKESLSDSFSIMIDIYITIATIYFSGDEKANSGNLARLTFLTENEVKKSIESLVKEGLLLKTQNGDFVPTTPPENMKLSQLYSGICGLKLSSRKSVDDFFKGGEKELNNRTVSDLIKNNDQ
jgi:membrane protein